MQEYNLKDLLVIKNGKDHKHLKDGKYPVYGSGGVIRYVDHFIWDKPSILLPRKGSLENVQFAEAPFWTIDTIYYTEIKNDKVDPLYLYYYLKLIDKSRLRSGTGLPSMTFSSYYNIRIKLPNLNVQKEISKFLKSIENKIIVNNQISKEITAIIKNTYDFWFSQYEFPNSEGKPYSTSGGKLKIGGNDSLLYPEHWKLGTLAEIANILMGQSPPGNSLSSKQVGMIFYQGSKDFGTLFPTVRTYTSKPIRIAKKGDVLLSVRAPAGAINVANNECCIGRGLAAISAKDGSNIKLFCLLLKYQKYIEALGNAGTTFGSLTKESLASIPVVIADKKIDQQFEDICRPLFTHLIKTYEENVKLADFLNMVIPYLYKNSIRKDVP